MSVKSDYHFCGLSRAQCAELFGRGEKTIRNWEKNGAPEYAKRFLLLYQGRLDFFGKAWKGFRITPECLEAPGGGDHVYPGEVYALRYIYAASGVDRTKLCTRLDEHDLLKVEMLKYQRPPSLVNLLPNNELIKLGILDKDALK